MKARTQLRQARRDFRPRHGEARDLVDAGVAIGQAHDTDLVHLNSLAGLHGGECHRMVTDFSPPGKECEGRPVCPTAAAAGYSESGNSRYSAYIMSRCLSSIGSSAASVCVSRVSNAALVLADIAHCWCGNGRNNAMTVAL